MKRGTNRPGPASSGKRIALTGPLSSAALLLSGTLLACNKGEAPKSPATDSAPSAAIGNAFDTSFEGYKSTKLGAAIYEGSLEDFKTLIRAGASPESCLTDETYIFDALYAALAFDRRAILDHILQSNLYKDINKTYTEESETPLTLACAIRSGKIADSPGSPIF